MFFENLKKGTDDAGAAGKSGKAGEAGEAGEATSSARNSELEGFKSAGVGKAARGRGKGKKKKSVTAATEETFPSRPTASSPRLSTVNCVLSPPPPPGAGSPPPPPHPLPPSSSSQTPWSCSLRKDTGEEFLDVLFSRVENPVKPRTKAMLVEGDTFEGTNGGTFTITKIVHANVGCKSSNSAANAGIDRCFCGQCNYSLCDGCVATQCGITEDAFARMSAEAHAQQDARIKAPYIEVRRRARQVPCCSVCVVCVCTPDIEVRRKARKACPIL